MIGKRFSSGRHQARGTAQGTGANSWNRHVATLKSFVAFSQRHGWINDEVDLVRALERRRAAEDHSKALDRETLDRLLTSRNVGVRNRCLWRLLYESAARATDRGAQPQPQRRGHRPDRPARRNHQQGRRHRRPALCQWHRPAPAESHGGRTRGPLFLAGRPPAPSRAVASSDLDPGTGQARLSYRRAAEIFTKASDGATLHQLRQSALTHLAEAGVPTVLLMAKSRHASLRTLQKYAKPGVEAVARLRPSMTQRAGGSEELRKSHRAARRGGSSRTPARCCRDAAQEEDRRHTTDARTSCSDSRS